MINDIAFDHEDESYEPTAEVEAAWAIEIEMRLRAIDSGEVRSIPWEEARLQIKRAIAKDEL
jgi:hypothetical protein